MYIHILGWTSNNSIFADLGMNYKPVVERVISNGEPGFAWLENMKQFSVCTHTTTYTKIHMMNACATCSSYHLISTCRSSHIHILRSSVCLAVRKIDVTRSKK